MKVILIKKLILVGDNMKFDETVVENTIKSITKSMQNIKSEMEKASNLLSSIEEEWEGKPSDYLTTNMRKSFNDFNSYIEVLGDYKKYLDGVLEDYKTTVSNNEDIINSVLGG